MTDDMYLPGDDVIQPQSSDNKQGRSGSFTEKEKEGIRWMMKAATDHSFEIYEALYKPAIEHGDEIRHVIYDVYSEETGWLDPDYQGLARELARTVLPLASYTELYWKQDLHNLLHLLKLRRDSHAQQECRDYAEAIYGLVKPLFPMTVEAWEDYVWNARTLSRMDVDLMSDLIALLPEGILESLVTQHGGEEEFAQTRGYALSELREFRKLWNL